MTDIINLLAQELHGPAARTKHTPHRDVTHKDYNAVGDAQILTDGAMTSGSKNYSAPSAAFTADDIGKRIQVHGAGVAGAPLITTIATFVDATHVTLTDAASTTVAGVGTRYGTNNTAPIQAAIDDTHAPADGILGGVVFLPPGWFFFSQLLIQHPVIMIGQSARRRSSTNTGYGTVLLCDDSTTAAAVYVQAPSATDTDRIRGVRLEQILLLGADDTEGTNRSDRRGLEFYHVQSETALVTLDISGFAREGFRTDEWWDATTVGCSIMWCGTDNLYPALYHSGGGSESTNAIRHFGLHMEQCAFMFKADSYANQIHFIGCKMEVGVGPGQITGHPVVIDNTCGVIVFNSHVATYRGAVAWATPSAQPHFFSIANEQTRFTGACQFISSPAGITGSSAQGAMWILGTGAVAIGSQSIFNACYPGGFAIDVGSRSKLEDLTCYVDVAASPAPAGDIGARNCIRVAAASSVKEITFRVNVTTTGATSGSLVKTTSNGNQIDGLIVDGDVNIGVDITGSNDVDHLTFNGAVTTAVNSIGTGSRVGPRLRFLSTVTNEFVAADYLNNIYEREVAGGMSPLDATTATPSVKGRDKFTVAASGTPITDLGEGYYGKRVTLFFTGARTVTNSAGVMNIGADFPGTTYDTLVLLRTGSGWVRVSGFAN